MRTFFFVPPVKRATGGVAVLYQLAAHLREAGFQVFMAPREGDGPECHRDPDTAVRRWDDLDLRPDDLWVVPEGWVNALTPGLQAGARCVVYCQNWAYLFSALPPGAQWDRLKVSFLSVSQPVQWFVRETTGQDSPVLRPGLDLDLFRPPAAKPEGPVRIAWMPRKNKALAEQIRSVFEARRARRGRAAEVRWVEIHGLGRDEVARLLGEAHVFLSTGFPEGCPLPPLEAMACGCLTTGYGGFGGWDYMRQADPGRPGAVVPWWPLRDAPWGGNGLWAADADVPAAALALEEAVDWWESRDPRLEQALAQAALTVRTYAAEKQRAAVLELWKRAAVGEVFL